MAAILCCSEKTLELHLRVCLHIDKILLNIVLDYEREWRHIMIDGDLPPGENTWATVWWARIRITIQCQARLLWYAIDVSWTTS